MGAFLARVAALTRHPWLLGWLALVDGGRYSTSADTKKPPSRDLGAALELLMLLTPMVLLFMAPTLFNDLLGWLYEDRI